MFHAALLHLMRVAAPTQTTFTISLKRSAATLAAGRASQPNTPSKYLMRGAESVADAERGHRHAAEVGCQLLDEMLVQLQIQRRLR